MRPFFGVMGMQLTRQGYDILLQEDIKQVLCEGREIPPSSPVPQGDLRPAVARLAEEILFLRNQVLYEKFLRRMQNAHVQDLVEDLQRAQRATLSSEAAVCLLCALLQNDYLQDRFSFVSSVSGFVL